MRSKSNKLLAALPVAGGAAWFGAGAIHLSGTEIQETAVETTAEHMLLVFFSAALVLTAVGVALLARYAANRTGAYVAITGMVLLAGAGTASNLNGGDYSWFPAVAGPANLLWLGGSIALAVTLKRAGNVSRWVYIGLPLVQIFALPLSSLGGSIVGGAYWIAVGTMLASGSIAARREPAAAMA